MKTLQGKFGGQREGGVWKFPSWLAGKKNYARFRCLLTERAKDPEFFPLWLLGLTVGLATAASKIQGGQNMMACRNSVLEQMQSQIELGPEFFFKKFRDFSGN